MSHTYKALALVWAILFGLVAISASGLVVGRWVLLLVGAALVMPTLVLTLFSKPRKTVGAITTSHERAPAVPLLRGGAGGRSARC